MKEVRYFYVPDAPNKEQLPEEEAQHAIRVLRLTKGDEIVLIDGVGNFFDATITATDRHNCHYRILRSHPFQPYWKGHIHLAMAPTKNIDRTEWVVEKATEIGFDQLSFLRCQFSERTQLKSERIERILISAMKQSKKALKPQLSDLCDFRQFVKAHSDVKHKFICHCYEGEKPLLQDVLPHQSDSLVMIGPEGDFSIEEVRIAEAAGFQSVSLGAARLRTETAALVAVHLMNLNNYILCPAVSPSGINP